MNKVFPFFTIITLFLGISFAAEKIEILTRDGIALKSSYAAPQQNKPILVMLHGLGADKNEWKPLWTALEENGWGWLAYDARGHGKSAVRSNEYKSFGPPGYGSPWQKMIDDVGAVVAFLKKQHKGAVPDIYIAGASLGANVSLQYAVLSRSIQGVILLSPGENYAGIQTTPVIDKSQRLRVLMVASAKDPYAYKSSLALNQAAPHSVLWTDVKPGHGVQMFDKLLLKRILQWLNENPKNQK